MRKVTSLVLSLISLTGILLSACAPSLLPGSSQPITNTGATSTPAGNALATGTPSPAVSQTANATLGGTATGSSITTVGATPIVVTVIPANGQTVTIIPAAETPTSNTAGGTATQDLTAQPTDQGLRVTLADDGKTIHLKVGDRFLLFLGEGFNWSPTVTDQNVVSRVVGITVIRGGQGVYEAKAPGTTTLLANGEPTCRQSKPACALPNRAFTVTLVVQ